LAFFDANDLWGDAPLYEELVRQLERHGIAGATVVDGIMGFGAHRRIHHKGLFGVVDDKPVMVVAIDREEKLRAVLPLIRPMVRAGVLALVDAEIISPLEESEPADSG
jgi:PII-like signaling protein